MDLLPVPTDEAARQLRSTLLGVETNVANWQRRQNANDGHDSLRHGVAAQGKVEECWSEV